MPGAVWHAALSTVPQDAPMLLVANEFLAARAPHYAAEVETARHRLVADDQMGQLFKVMALAAPGWPDGVGFEEA